MLPTPPICDPALHGCIYRVAGFPETKVSLAQICVPMPLSTGVHLCYSINFRNKLARRLKSCRPESDWSRLVEIYGLASIHPVHSSTTSYGQGISDHQPQLSRLKNSPRGWVLCDRQNRSVDVSAFRLLVFVVRTPAHWSARTPGIPLLPSEQPPSRSRKRVMSTDTMQIDDIRKKFGRFRVLIIGRANAGKTTILKKICNSIEDPEIYDDQGNRVGLYIVRLVLTRN